MAKRFLSVVVALVLAFMFCSVCVFAAGNAPGGFVVDFGDDYHGILINGQVVSLEHDLDENGVCTICGYGAAEASADGGVEVDTPTQETNNVDDPDDTDNIEVTDKTPDENPKTGVVLAVIPMLVAAAAIVVSRKR